MRDTPIVYVPTLTPALWEFLRGVYREHPPRILVEMESLELEEVTAGEPESGPDRYYTLVNEQETNGQTSEPDIALLDESEPGEVMLIDEHDLGSETVKRARILLIVLGVQPLSAHLWEHETTADRAIGVRPVFRDGGLANIEIVEGPTTDPALLEELIDHLRGARTPVSTLWGDVPGGGSQRVRTAVETEAWSLIRTGVAEPGAVEALTAALFGHDRGVLTGIRDRDPDAVWLETAELARATFCDGRFRPQHDEYPPEHAPFWETALVSPAPPEIAGGHRKRPGRALIVGSPHLATLWRDHIYETSGGKLNATTWELWDSGSATEEGLLEVKESGPYDLLLEVLVGPLDERQQILDLLLPQLAKDAQVWVHTLNLPATMIVQPVPQTFTAVGFSGLPPLAGTRTLEMIRPRNSSAADLNRAIGAAAALGYTPVEVSDEPGGVSARLLAVIVNTVAWTLHEGLFASPAEADTAAARTFGMNVGPLRLADEIGLDVFEAVMLGLQATLGGERYRFCPLLTLRIEAGELGRVTGKGFYVP